MSIKRVSAVLASSAVLVAGGVLFGAGSAAAEESVAEPATFTSAYTAMATPDMVINNDNVPTPGTAGAWGTFNYRINADLDIICYDIEITGITEPYQSPAKTATHIHEGAAGKAGPPRLAFPNPVKGSDGVFTSAGCLKGPFTTGLNNATTGKDTGEGFTVAQIEANPSAFFTDTHTAANPAGAVRGQLTAVPVGGIETGAGGTVTDLTGGFPVLPAAGAAVLLAGAAIALRRRSATA